MGKFELIACFAWAMFILEKALRTQKAVWFALCGTLFAMGISVQPDIGLLMTIIPAGYTLFHWLHLSEWKAKRAVVLKLLIAAIAFAIIILPAFSGSITNLITKEPAKKIEITETAPKITPTEKWNWATSWSLPREEVFEFICPGFFGIHSGHAESPYWGRVGPADCPRVQNFRQNGEYLGVIPFAFFLVAIGLALCKGTLETKIRKEIFFWTAIVIGSLLLAFGRFAPFYGLFYKIPYMDQMRAPVKFINLLDFAFSILAAFGLDGLLCNRQKKIAQQVMRGFIGITVVGLATAGVIALKETSITAWLAQQKFPQEIIGNMHAGMIRALLRMSLLTALTGGFLFAYGKEKLFFTHREKLTLILLAVFALDMVEFSKRYIHTAPYNQLYHENRMIKFLEKHRTDGRIKFLSRQGIYNHWLTNYMSYFDLQSIDVPAMRTMPEDYGNFFQALEKNPVRLFQLTSTRYFIGPDQIWRQLCRLAPNDFKPVERYRVAQLANQSIETLPDPTGSEILGTLTTALPRAGLYTHWTALDDTAVLKQLGAPTFEPTTTVLTQEDFTRPASAPVPVQKLEITEYKVNRIEIQLPKLTVPGLVVLTDRFDPAWKVTLDGNPADLLRCNYIMRGVAVQPGDHTIVMSYTPFRTQFIISAAGLIAVFLWAAIESLSQKKNYEKNN
ncbi:MAG: hypothetical protein WC047_00640 [Kiritimatiellales bacterium]